MDRSALYVTANQVQMKLVELILMSRELPT